MEINIKKIKPMFNQLVTTMRVYGVDEQKQGSIIDINKINNPIKEYQTVVAIGPMVKNVNVGDLVMINPTRYKKVKHNEGSLKDGIIGDNMTVGYNFPTITLDHKEYLFLSDQDVAFVIEEYEEEQEPPTVITPNKDIIL